MDTEAVERRPRRRRRRVRRCEERAASELEDVTRSPGRKSFRTRACLQALTMALMLRFTVIHRVLQTFRFSTKILRG